MNVNGESPEFCNIVPWESLTDAEKASGEWIELPNVSGESRWARPASAIESLFAAARSGKIEDLEDQMRRRIREFDATGKAR